MLNFWANQYLVFIQSRHAVRQNAGAFFCNHGAADFMEAAGYLFLLVFHIHNNRHDETDEQRTSITDEADHKNKMPLLRHLSGSRLQ